MSSSVRVADSLHEEGEKYRIAPIRPLHSVLHRFSDFRWGARHQHAIPDCRYPDWPTTYGWNMFAFPFSKWVGGIFYEHSHRLVASFVGFLTVILAFWTWLREKRQWVRWLAVAALGAVMAQGILGGLTVILLLPTAISMAHACLAQTFFCLVISIALFTSPQWKQGLPAAHSTTSSGSSITLPALCTMTTGAIYIQLMLGALMRHTDSGLAIRDFPLSFGRIVPHFTSSHIAIHFSHRVGALLVSGMIVWTFLRVRREYARYSLLIRPRNAAVFTAVDSVTPRGKHRLE